MIRVKVVGYNLKAKKDNYFANFLTSNSRFQLIEENPDLVFVDLHSYKQTKATYPNTKMIVASGENIYNTPPYHLQYLRKFKLDYPLVRSCLPRIWTYKFVLKELSNPNTFWILCNSLKAPKVLNFPYFFTTCLHYIEDLVRIKEAKLYTKKRKFCAFIAANPAALDRIKVFKKLSQYKKVDSYGSVLNNSKVPQYLIEKHKYEGISLSEALKAKHHRQVAYSDFLNQELFRDYKFVICFENSFEPDYITEKLPNAMLANAIGIYKGAPNVGEFFNTKSFINYDDYRSFDAMIERIIELDQDEAQYQAMLAEPFFVNNELPPRIKTAHQDLENFILKITKNA